ncbi:NAD(P)-dependent iron-only hydrogenase diaphorase component iron-sulfur protein [Bacteroides luti]|uniref:NAD(P)-dependent iron-only hydrogenase diaphorase component iron-sulfur protein n=1 Tax=Bacteroides luti TaxID=1297750 RepID=A0A1M5BB92_9BACE|nr:NAD(P)H-dependent oxidoreductase subunit E [Bacteroides luti]SHF39432.1 NAD(P)-dependent iron-only hydrogenase diaphorase component iron-sulfur protein [Bacteroides luti]
MITEDDICNVHMMTEEEKYNLLKDVIIDYDRKEDNLIQILHMAQAIFGYLPTEVQHFIASQMDLSVSKVNSVLTFYSFFSTKPKGKYTISVCLGTACYVRGGKEVLNKLKDELGIDVGETTPDKRYSLTVMRCIGSCGLAPAMTINGKVYKQVNPNRIKRILGTLK